MADFSTGFIRTFNAIQKQVHETAKEKGWWDCPEINKAEKIALMHSELSECLEALRRGNIHQDIHCAEFYNAEVELADTIIRIMDFAEKFKLPVAEALIAKAAYNKTRTHKHGGKAF